MSTMSTIDKVFLWIIRGGFFLLLFTPLIVAQNLFFPFITAKAFYFRIITEVMFGVWLALAVLNPAFRPRKSPLLIAFSLFVAILIFATFFGVDPYHSFWSNFERMEGLITHLHLLALFFVLAHSVRSEKEWFGFLHISVGVSVVAALYGFLQYLDVVEIIGEARPYATFGNSIYLAVYLMFHLFFLAMLLFRTRNNWFRAFYAAVFVFELVVFFIAASRGAFIGLFGGIAVVAAMFMMFSRLRFLKAASIAVILLIAVLIGVVFYAPSNPLVKNIEVLSRLSSVSFKNLSTNPRIMIWGIAVEAIRERPMLGWGPENFIVPFAKYYNPNLFGNEPWFDRAHNMLLEWMVAAGMLGFFAYLSIFISAGYILLKLVRNQKMQSHVAILIVGVFSAYIAQNVFVFDNLITYILLIFILAFLHQSFTELARVDFKKAGGSASYSKNTIFPDRLVLAAGIVIATAFPVYFLNVKPILAADQLIDALQSFSKNSTVEEVISEFDKTIAYNTFGTTEARERVTDTVVQIAVNVDHTNEAFNKLLRYSIGEMEKEIVRNELAPRPPVFLGKLYTVLMNVTGEGFEKAETFYNRANHLSPHYIQTYLGLAELYLIVGQNEKAVDIARTAFSLPDRLGTLGSLFYPVFSVHILAAEFQEAANLIKEHRQRTGSPIFGPLSEDIPLLILRAQRSSDLIGRIMFFETLNQLFIEDYGFSHPLVLLEIINMYEIAGNNRKAQEIAKVYASDEYKERARDYTEKVLRETSSPESAKRLIAAFITDLESLP